MASGLCEKCVHRKSIRNDRGSVFTMCLRGLTDPAYPKYPRLPVLNCAAFQQSLQPAAPTTNP
jgi:hypothetical protein